MVRPRPRTPTLSAAGAGPLPPSARFLPDLQLLQAPPQADSRAATHVRASTSQPAVPALTACAGKHRRRLSLIPVVPEQPQLAFEMASVPAGALRVSRPRIALAAFATVEVLQVRRHLIEPNFRFASKSVG